MISQRELELKSSSMLRTVLAACLFAATGAATAGPAKFKEVKPVAINPDTPGCATAKWFKGAGNPNSLDPKDKAKDRMGLVLAQLCDTEEAASAQGILKNLKGVVVIGSDDVPETGAAAKAKKAKKPKPTDAAAEIAFDLLGECGDSPRLEVSYQDTDGMPQVAPFFCWEGAQSDVDENGWQTVTFSFSDLLFLGGEVIDSARIIVDDQTEAGYQLDNIRVGDVVVGRK